MVIDVDRCLRNTKGLREEQREHSNWESELNPETAQQCVYIPSVMPASLSAVATVVKNVYMHCPVSVRLRCIHAEENQLPIALSGCYSEIWINPVLIRLTRLHALIDGLGP